MVRQSIWMGVCVVLIMVTGTSAQQAFTYQGLVKQNGIPLDGNVPMTFRLYTLAENGTLLGTQTLGGVPVSQGVFTVLLNDVN